MCHLFGGVIELAAFAKPAVSRLDKKLTVWLSGPCAHRAQTCAQIRTHKRRAPRARASPDRDRRRQRGGEERQLETDAKTVGVRTLTTSDGPEPRPRPSADRDAPHSTHHHRPLALAAPGTRAWTRTKAHAAQLTHASRADVDSRATACPRTPKAPSRPGKQITPCRQKSHTGFKRMSSEIEPSPVMDGVMYVMRSVSPTPPSHLVT